MKSFILFFIVLYYLGHNSWATILKTVDFGHSLGLYTKEDFKSDWGINAPQSSGLPQGRLEIVQDPENGNNKVLKVGYPSGGIGGSNGMVFYAPIDGQHQNMWIQYRLRFPSDFDWVKGGKLPGLGGGDTPTGCIDDGDFTGWTSRLMWEANGGAHNYLYYPGKQARCGDSYKMKVQFEKDRWYTIKQQLKLNDVGQSNGFLYQYVDDVEVNSITDWKWRNEGDIYVTAICMSTFFGGSTNDWAPPKDEHIYIDDFILSDSKI